MILNTGKTLPKISQNLSKQSNVLPVFNVTEQRVLVQSIYVKQVNLGSLYLSATLDNLRFEFQVAHSSTYIF